MSSDLFGAMTISSRGMQAQSTRIRVVSENIANSATTGLTPGSDPYQRKTITFKNAMDRQAGMKLVEVDDIGTDKKTPFKMKYMPDSPAADQNGYVKMPNVDPLIEMMDMKEAQRSYQANLGVIDESRNMILQTIGLLKSQ